MRESDEIAEQLMLLHKVLQWSTAHPDVSTALTTGERIMVNQERGNLFREYDGQPVTGFTQSDQVNEKIIRIEYLIKRNNWKPKD